MARLIPAFSREFAAAGSDPRRKPVDNNIEQRLGQTAIHETVQLREIAVEFMRCEQHFESAPTAEESRQPRHRTAAGNQGGTHFPIAKGGPFHGSQIVCRTGERVRCQRLLRARGSR